MLYKAARTTRGYDCTQQEHVGIVMLPVVQDKFRTIKLSNAAFQSRVAVVPAAVHFMVTAGFQVRR